jgi:hypothetical protein
MVLGRHARKCSYENHPAGISSDPGPIRSKPVPFIIAALWLSATGAAMDLRNSPPSRGAGYLFPLKTLIFHRCPSHVIFVTNALVQRMPICYMQRAGQVSALPRAVVAELVDAQR